MPALLPRNRHWVHGGINRQRVQRTGAQRNQCKVKHEKPPVEAQSFAQSASRSIWNGAATLPKGTALVAKWPLLAISAKSCQTAIGPFSAWTAAVRCWHLRTPNCTKGGHSFGGLDRFFEDLTRPYDRWPWPEQFWLSPYLRDTGGRGFSGQLQSDPSSSALGIVGGRGANGRMTGGGGHFHRAHPGFRRGHSRMP